MNENHNVQARNTQLKLQSYNKLLLLFSVDNYTLGERKTTECECPLRNEKDEAQIEMKVTNGSKMKNLMTYASKKINDPKIRHMLWSGHGATISKTISCSEILKRRTKGLHQITHIAYNRVEEFWEPKQEGLDRLKVNKDIPVMTILLSKDPLDTSNPSYQAPGSTTPFSNHTESRDKASKPARQHNRKPGNGTSSETFTAPSMDRKRKRKGGSEGPGRPSGGQKQQQKPKNQKPKQQSKKKDSEPPTADVVGATEVGSKSQEQGSSLLDKLDEITKAASK